MDLSILTLINEGWTPLWLDLLMILLTTLGLATFGLMTLAAWQDSLPLSLPTSWRGGDRQLGWSLLLAQIAALIGVLVFYFLRRARQP